MSIPPLHQTVHSCKLYVERLLEADRKRRACNKTVISTSTSTAQKEDQSRMSKHYVIKAAFLPDSFKRGIFCYSKVGTKDQLADSFAKPLTRDDFISFRELMGVKVFELEQAR